VTLYADPMTGGYIDTSNPIKFKRCGRTWIIWIRSRRGVGYESTYAGPFPSFDACWAYLDRLTGAA
jgi:hypothetical protein